MAVASLGANNSRMDSIWTPFPSDFLSRINETKNFDLLVTPINGNENSHFSSEKLSMLCQA